ncbi:MAG: hypothetical protein JNK60_17030 [Acidobacteria bacterium]|nr:hypothetical protein [Acidobacteriota bacterium]
MSFSLLLLVLASQPVPPPAPPVAVVYETSGPVSLVSAAAERGPLVPPAWIPAGSRVITERGGSAFVALRSGDRFVLRDGAAGTVSERGLEERNGTIVQLRSVSGLSILAPLRSPVATASGATRFRMEHIPVLFPQSGAAIEATGVTLRFERDRNLAKCSAVVEDESGAVVFESEAAGAEVAVKDGSLKPGRSYYLRILGEALDGRRVSGEASFRTISLSEAEALAALRASLPPGEGDALFEAARKALGNRGE